MKKLTGIFNLHEGEDNREKVLAGIAGNISFRGANLWTLACAIIIASVGLNVNSPAFIIGAMLISPLMGPIVGAGFALGIYDFALLKKSLYNLLVATVVSLTVSTLYFFISPFKEVQSELLARTSPNIFDILIAFFGGIVGVIAVTRVEKGNPIPGVAIATALMPPLCTAGYGIATAHWDFFIGAFYLYSLNCVFIGIATFLLVKYLKYAPKQQVNATRQKQVRNIITVLTVLMLVPGAYLAYSLYREQQFKKNIDGFIESNFTDKGYTIVYKKTDFNTTPKRVELAFLSKRFQKSEMDSLNKKLNSNKYLKGSLLVVRQDTTDRLTALKGDLMNRMKSSENEINQKDVKIAQLEGQLAKNSFDSKMLLKEVKTLFPDVTSLSVANHTLAMPKDSTATITAVLYGGKKELSAQDTEKLQNWLAQRLAVKQAKVFKAD